MKKILITLIITWLATIVQAQDATAILKKTDKKMRGNTSYAEISIEVIRPKWKKTMKLKSWTMGEDFAVSLVTYPAKERGIVFLKRYREMWNYIPSIERRIKLPPSMMLQSWMGTDLTNDDLVKQSSIVHDYTHEITGEEIISGLPCWKITLTPKEDAPVVWGKIILWIDRSDYMQMKAEFYDEDGFAVNRMQAYDPKVFDGRKLPSRIEFIPMDKPGHKTVIRYENWKFDLPVDEKLFTVNHMSRFIL